MSTIELSATPAHFRSSGVLVVTYDLLADKIAPREVVEVRTIKDVEAAIASYSDKVAATGSGFQISVRLKDGRAPSGFRSMKRTRLVNVAAA